MKKDKENPMVRIMLQLIVIIIASSITLIKLGPIFALVLIGSGLLWVFLDFVHMNKIQTTKHK